MTDGSHSNARIVDIRPIRVQEELNRRSVIVLAGFQGVNPETKEITTLGRGGSDTTAIAMAAKFQAARCEIIKEVDGICTADPRVITKTKSIPRVTYSALREMCYWGAKVLHYRSIALAEEAAVPLIIKRWGSPNGITEVVKEDHKMEQCQILSVNSLNFIEHVEITAPTLNKAYVMFEEHLAKHQLARPQMLASAYDKAARLMITGEKELLDSILRSFKDSPNIKSLNKTLSSVTVTCHGSVATDLAAKAMARLEIDGIIVDKVLFTPMSFTVCVQPAHRETAIRALHSMI
jgi:aspartate kinase